MSRVIEMLTRLREAYVERTGEEPHHYVLDKGTYAEYQEETWEEREATQVVASPKPEGWHMRHWQFMGAPVLVGPWGDSEAFGGLFVGHLTTMGELMAANREAKKDKLFPMTEAQEKLAALHRAGHPMSVVKPRSTGMSTMFLNPRYMKPRETAAPKPSLESLMAAELGGLKEFIDRLPSLVAAVLKKHSAQEADTAFPEDVFENDSREEAEDSETTEG